MLGLIIAIVVFNLVAFKANKTLTANQIVHIWTFTIAFQVCFDVFMEFDFHAYWYFSKDIEWEGLIPHLFVVSPVNMMYLNWFPFHSIKIKQFFYIVIFVIAILMYELLTLLPEPWGYFHWGWWKFWHAVVLDPILLLIVLSYYKWIVMLEKNLSVNKN